MSGGAVEAKATLLNTSTLFISRLPWHLDMPEEGFAASTISYSEALQRRLLTHSFNYEKVHLYRWTAGTPAPWLSTGEDLNITWHLLHETLASYLSFTDVGQAAPAINGLKSVFRGAFDGGDFKTSSGAGFDHIVILYFVHQWEALPPEVRRMLNHLD